MIPIFIATLMWVFAPVPWLVTAIHLLISNNTFPMWFALYLFISFIITTHFEEKELIKRYGEEYLAYKKQTPVFFII